MLPRSLRRAVLPLTAPVGSVRSLRSPDPVVVLTYDDGPEPGGTERVLDVLSAHRATATFFVLVRRAEREPGLLREVLAAGHEVALHGIDHVRLTTLPAAEVRRRTADGRRRLEDLIGAPVRWFRPPYGAQTPATWLAIRRAGLHSVVWTATGYDWRDDPVSTIAARAVDSTVPGSVLLLHDGHAGPCDGVDDGPRPAFDRGELSERVLGVFAERGWAARSLADALTAGTLVRGAWFRR